MKVLYLTYGTQSGVVTKLSNVLSEYEIFCNIVNVASGLNYRYNKIKFPRLSSSSIINCLVSYNLFKKRWKEYYFRTDYAYKWMSRKSENIIDGENQCDIILQSGLFFSPEKRNNKPYVLGILDNTYLIGKYGRSRPVSTLNLTEFFIKKEADAYRNADLLLVMSNHVKNSLIEDYKVDENKIVITGVGPNVEPDCNHVNSDSKYVSGKIIMIAMDFYRKGGFDVLEAFKRLKKRMNYINLVVIGERVNVQTEGVEFIGIQDREKIKEELSEANLFVMPSYIEPFGVSFIEAMSFGTPCIGSRVEAIPEIISDGETGFLVTPKDVDDIEDRMEEILRDSFLAKSMGSAGYKKYKERFAWDKIGKIITDRLYNFV